MDGQDIRRPSYDSEWSIAQVASHLGSQGEIYTMFLDAGLAGRDAPGVDQCQPIWDRWNNSPPEQQVSNSVVANEKFLARLESLSQAETASFALSLEGADLDAAGFAASRLSEYVLHTWDIVVTLDPAATLPVDAVELLIDTLPALADRAGRPSPDYRKVTVRTVDPERSFEVTTGPSVTFTTGASAQTSDPGRVDDVAMLQMPGEALVRLVFGRVDPAHTPSGLADNASLAVLRDLFPGF